MWSNLLIQGGIVNQNGLSQKVIEKSGASNFLNIIWCLWKMMFFQQKNSEQFIELQQKTLKYEEYLQT